MGGGLERGANEVNVEEGVTYMGKRVDMEVVLVGIDRSKNRSASTVHYLFAYVDSWRSTCWI